MKVELKRIVFTKPNTAEYLSVEEVDLDALGEYQVAVKSFYTTVSAGTERANITGASNVGPKNKVAPFPRVLGYNCAGEVEDGSNFKKWNDKEITLVLRACGIDCDYKAKIEL